MREHLVGAVVALVACGPAVSPPRSHAPPPRASPLATVTPTRDPLGEASLDADLAWLTDPAREGRGAQQAIATAKWIAAELVNAGYAPVLQPIGGGHLNVIAERGPRDEAPAIVVVAHYDHLGIVDGRVYPGADDNASGVAVALAVARSLPDAASPARLHHRVVFVFTGLEEHGLIGAKAFVAKPTVPLDRVRAVYNLDMVGRMFGDAPQLIAVGILDDDDLTERARAVAEAAGLTLLPLRAGVLDVLGQDHRSDDWAFRDRGISAVHFSTGMSPDYHAPTDTADKVSRPQLVRVATFLRALVASSLSAR